MINQFVKLLGNFGNMECLWINKSLKEPNSILIYANEWINIMQMKIEVCCPTKINVEKLTNESISGVEKWKWGFWIIFQSTISYTMELESKLKNLIKNLKKYVNEKVCLGWHSRGKVTISLALCDLTASHVYLLWL